MKNKNTGRAAPLKVKIKNGVFTVSIGVETLAWGFEHGPECQVFNKDYELIDEDTEHPEFIQKYSVTDPDEFAEDVLREFEREKEDGTTPLYEFFDKMCMNAVEDGSIAINEPNGLPADEKLFCERVKEWRKGV